MSIASTAAKAARAASARATAAAKSWKTARHAIPSSGIAASRLAAVGLAGVARSGTKHFIKLAKTNPAKFIAGVLTWATIDHYTDEWLNELEQAAGDDAEVNAAISEAREQLAELKLETSPYEEQDEDGKVGSHQLDAFSISAYKEAKAIFRRASSVVGGRDRLIALQSFFQLDPDLKRLVIEDSITGDP